MPSSSGGTTGQPSASNPQVFLPPNQPAAADQWWNTLGPLANLAGNAGAGTPAAWSYPQAQAAYATAGPWSQFTTDINSPGYQQALLGANATANYAPTLFGQAQTGSNVLQGDSLTALATAFNNPNFYQSDFSNAQQLTNAGTGVLNTAFDPQSALYNRTQQQVLDQQNAVNSMSGIASTPYGAGVTGQTLGNFNIDWQNQQLRRQAEGLGAAGSAFGQAGSLQNLPLQAELAGLQGGLSGLAGAQNLGAAGAQANATLSGLPYGTQTQGTQNAYNTVGNQLSGLASLTNLGNNQFVLPESVLGNLQSYLGLGQSASGLANQVGSTNFNELASGIGAGSSLLFGNSLNNSGGLLGLSGLSGLSGVPSSAASAASISSALPGLGDAALGGPAGFGIGSGALGAEGAIGDLGAAGFGDTLASAAPLALSA